MNIESDLTLLHQAVRLAVQGHGSAEPNPLVGCIITNDQGAIVGEGFHEQFGQNHAEINALAIAGKNARGGTAYITLEPCNHQGKTPPCSEALIQAGIQRVVIGNADPNVHASGGAQALRVAGIDVAILDDEKCKGIIAPFAYRCRTGLPWVTCKWAQTTDGCIETPEGDSSWISSIESQQLVHEERGCVDAILVGIGTVLADNPNLTVRNAPIYRTPLRVVIDPSLRTPLDAHVLSDEAPTLLAHRIGVDASEFNCETIALPEQGDTLDLTPLLKHLVVAYDATNIIVEGGAITFKHVFQQQLANELWVFTSATASNMHPTINMNTLVQTLGTHLLEEDLCGTDTVCRYAVSYGE
jgi:diaminohydroxyphosphoribosylaminopyrimidine deaminase/5-amino-6-(5-phosphoribosylamino)uracil reductase